MFFFVYKDKKLRYVNILNRVLKVKENLVDIMSKYRLLWKLLLRLAWWVSLADFRSFS